MDWIGIGANCIRSLVKFRQWVYHTHGPFGVMSEYGGGLLCQDNEDPEDNYTLGNRVLYDFFDEQEIRVFIEWGINQSDHGKLIYYFKIFYSKEMNFVAGSRQYSTRTEAEEQAFTKAFQLLEEKLNGGK